MDTDAKTNDLVVVSVGKLWEIVGAAVDTTMEKWFSKQREADAEDKKNEETLLTLKEVCEQFKVGQPTIYAKIKDEKLSPKRIGKKLYFFKADIIEAIKDGRLR